MTAMRTLLRTSLICLGVTSSVAPAYAQHTPLPSSPSSWLEGVPSPDEVTSGLNDGRFTANGCTVEAGALSCRCLRGEGQAYARWSNVAIEGFALERDGVVTIGSALYVDGLWVLENVVVQQPETVLTIDQMRLGALAEAAGLTWYERTEDAVVGCHAEVPRGKRVAVAKGATLEDDRWRLRGYRVGAWPLPLAGPARRAAPGLLPPTVRTTSDGAVQAEGAASVFGPLFAFAAGGLDAPFGGGVGVVSQRRDEGMALRAMVAANDADVSPVVIGDLSFGGATHVRGHVEHPMLERSWAVRRAEHGGFFRDWRATHVGIAATAGAHALQLSGAIVTEPDRPSDEQAVLLTYGTTFSSGGLAQWTVDLEHGSDRTEDTRHSTTVGVGVDVPIGWVERAWLTPRLDLLANYAAVTVSRGFDASTTLSALGSVEAGLAFEGRFAGGRHRLAPVLRAGGELTGIQQRQAREGAPPYPYNGPDRWRWATAFLEQSVQTGPLLLELPVGVFVDAFGDEALADAPAAPVVFGRAGAALPQARVDLAAACVDACERVGTYLGASVRPRPGLRIGYSVADLDDAEVALVFADRLTDRAFTAIRLLETPGTSTGFGHVATLGWRLGRASLGLEGRYGVDAGARGVGAQFGYFWEPLGWGIGAGGSIGIPSEEWAISAGLRFAR